MKSIVYGPANEPVWKNSRPIPRCGKDQVLVRVHAVGLNPVDAKGVIGDKLPNGWTTLQSLARRCVVQSKVIGFDFAGVVEETNSSNSKGTFVPGDRVYGILPPSRYDGTLQEHITVSVDQLARVPDTLPLTQAAALPLVGITALQCLQGAGWGQPPPHTSDDDDNNNSNSNKKLLVIGASGGTGHVAVQIGQCLQPQAQVVAVCSARNANFVRNLMTGSSEDNNKSKQQPKITILDYHADDFEQQLQAAGPFDVVMDCVTSGDPRDQATLDYRKLLLSDNRFISPHGQYRRLGGFFPDWCRASIERVTGVHSVWSNPSAKLFWIQMHQAAPALEQLADWISQGTLQGAHVAQTVPFTPQGVQQGFEALLGRRVVGKVVVEFPSPEDNTQSETDDTVQPSRTKGQDDKKQS